MTDLHVNYMGIRLKNPLIISSSSLTGTLDGIKKAAASGAGALVLKSLFEEQIIADLNTDTQGMDDYSHPEASEYLAGLGMQLGPRDYLELIKQAKSQVDIPLIASVNCVGQRWWEEYATQLSLSGADGVEVNISVLPRSVTETSHSVEKYILGIIEKISTHLTIPFSVKLGPYFTALPHLATDIRRLGAKGLVLFNRFYQFDIDLDNVGLTAGIQFSTPQDYNTTLRWLSILHGHVGMDLVGSTGVHDGKTLVKMLLAGAVGVQVCSAIYKHGYPIVGQMLKTLEDWMNIKGYTKVEDIIGMLSQEHSDQPELYERLQYIKALTKIY